MPTSGIFVYTVLSDTTAGLGTGKYWDDGNGFVEKTKVSGDIKIPRFIGQYRMVKLLSFSSRNCDGITSLTLPDTLIEIQYGALTELHNIDIVVIPASVITIDNNNDYFTKRRNLCLKGEAD